MNDNLLFIGLSHLALNYGVTAAKKYKNVHFFDFKKKIQAFKDKKIKFDEPKLNTYLEKYKKNIYFNYNLPSINSNTIIFLAIDIKTLKNNKSDYKYINKLLKFIDENIHKKNLSLVVMSQVQPNFTRKINWPNKNLYYHVETLIFGDAVNRAENPERIIIGTHDGKRVKNKKYLDYLKSFKCELIFMKYEEAELCKMFINAYLVSNVTLSNNLASICKKLNLDWDKPKKALKLDRRIGKYSYLDPGLGISGGNLERDIYNLNQISKSLKLNTHLFQVFIDESKKQKNWINNKVNFLIKKKFIINNSKIGLLGVTYKENTNSVKNSPSLNIISHLKEFNLFCYDPIVQNLNINLLKINWLSLKAIVNKCDILFIMHKNIDINPILFEDIKKINKKVLIDPYKTIKKNINKNTLYYDSL